MLSHLSCGPSKDIGVRCPVRDIWVRGPTGECRDSGLPRLEVSRILVSEVRKGSWSGKYRRDPRCDQ